MRNVVRGLLALAVVATAVEVSWAQTWRDAGSKINGNYNGVYFTNPGARTNNNYVAPNTIARNYQSYSYAPQANTTAKAPATTNVAPAPQARVAPAPQPAVTAPRVQTQQPQGQVRTRRNYSYQPQPSVRPFTYTPGYRTMAPNGYRTRADSKVLAD
jgi:hypothetical protein